MNGNLKKVCSIVLSLIICFSTVSVCYAERNMKIDESKTIKEIDRIMYGINQEWSITNYTYYLKGSNSSEIAEEFVNCYKNSIGLARMAGTSSDWVKWKNNMGPLQDRKANRLWGITDIVRYGMVEWLKSIQAADADAKFTYVVNVISDNYENMADAIEFLVGDGITNPNGGINWGRVRIESGVKEPADIFVYEIGNETDTTGGGGISLDEYIKRAKEAIAVIRSVDRNAKIAVHNKTGNMTPSYDYYDHRLLQELGDQIDYLSVHGYYLPNEDPERIGKDSFIDHVRRIGRMENSIRKITGSDRIKIYQSEHAGGRYNSDTTAGYDFVVPHTMMGTMESAEWFLRMMWHPLIEASTYHSTDSSSWCIAYQEDGVMKMSAIGNLLQLMLKYGTGKACYSELDGFKYEEMAEVVGQAVKNDEGLTVIMVNKKDVPETINFTLNNKYKVKNVAYIQADDYKADNYKGSKGINVIWNAEVPEGEFSSYTLDKYSVTFITLEEIGEKVVSE